MTPGHNHWRRLLHRTLEEMYATARIAGETSWGGALHTFFTKAEIQIMNRQGYYESPGATRRLLKKHAVMRRYFDKTYGDFLASYPFPDVIPDRDNGLGEGIWMCWWQGLDQAPEIVRKCVESVRKNAAGRRVTVITEENYREYVQLPLWLEEKYRAGILSRTHFSDILRMSLLASYGGVWLDATVFCAGNSLEDCFRGPVWSIKRPDYGHISAGCGGFTTGAMGCRYEYRWIFAVFRDFLLQYWKENDFLVDYLMLDYLIDLALRNNDQIRHAFCRIEPNNAQSDNLIKRMNEPYEEALWQEMKKDTFLFKLSWKQNFAETQNGKDTFYAKLLKEEL